MSIRQNVLDGETTQEVKTNNEHLQQVEQAKRLRQLLNEEDKQVKQMKEATRGASLGTNHIALLSTCGLGLLATWSNNKLIKCAFSSLLAYKAYKLYTTDESIKEFIEKML